MSSPKRDLRKGGMWGNRYPRESVSNLSLPPFITFIPCNYLIQDTPLFMWVPYYPKPINIRVTYSTAVYWVRRLFLDSIEVRRAPPSLSPINKQRRIRDSEKTFSECRTFLLYLRFKAESEQLVATYLCSVGFVGPLGLLLSLDLDCQHLHWP